MDAQYGTRKKSPPGKLKYLRANPYTLRVTSDSISYTLAYVESFWTLSLQGVTGTAASRGLGYNTKVLGFERIRITSPSISGGQTSRRSDFARVPRTVCVSQAIWVGATGRRGRQAHEAGDPGTPADGFLEKIMNLHDSPEK